MKLIWFTRRDVLLPGEGYFRLSAVTEKMPVKQCFPEGGIVSIKKPELSSGFPENPADTAAWI